MHDNMQVEPCICVVMLIVMLVFVNGVILGAAVSVREAATRVGICCGRPYGRAHPAYTDTGTDYDGCNGDAGDADTDAESSWNEIRDPWSRVASYDGALGSQSAARADRVEPCRADAVGRGGSVLQPRVYGQERC
jgi:hypothetical protein